MRLLGEFNNPDQAKRLSDYLTHFNIDNRIQDDGDGIHEVWIVFEDEVERAEQLFTRFRENPGSINFQEVARKAEEVRGKKRKEEKKAPAYIDARTTIFNRSALTQGKLTMLLIFACIVVAVFSRLGNNLDSVRPLLITNFRIGGLQEIMNGEIWRLVTPMFIHFGILHLAFNMMWLLDLGSTIERNKGTLFLGVFVLVVSTVSNLTQYLLYGPGFFGGMSGVVYGLLGYVWAKGKYDPTSNLHLHEPIAIFMMVWLVLGFTGMIGNIANGAHVGGLAAGAAWGFFSSKH